MSSEHAGKSDDQKLCFVVMGFGKKTDFQTGRVINLDKTYTNIIKPAAEEAGLKCVRADEMVNFGLIDVPMYEQLLSADVVIADLSTSNRIAFYELGVRHALRPNTTIIIAEDQFKFPFDTSRMIVRQYHHMGEGIDFDEIMRFRQVLRDALVEALSNPQVDSPVYTFLDKLKPPSLGGEGALLPAPPPHGQERRPSPPPVTAATIAPSPPEPSPQYKRLVGLVEQLEKAVKDGQFAEAGRLFADALNVLQDSQDDGTAMSYPNLVQRMVLAASQVEGSARSETLSGARIMLLNAGAEDSNDPEALQLLGHIEVALFKETRQVTLLVRARRTYERLHAIRRTYSSGIAFANLIALHAEYKKNIADKISDIVSANRLRDEVVEIGKEKLASIEERYRTEARLLAEKGSPAALKAAEAEEKLEVWGAIAEAYYGLGDKDNYGGALDEAQLLQGASKRLKDVDSRVKQLGPVWERQAALLSSVEDFIQPPPTQPPVISLTTPAQSVVEEEAEAPTPEEPTSVRDLVFISYSHNERDIGILEEIKKTLTPAFRKRKITLWDDSQIEAGENWRDAIKDALSRARAAVLLVSRDFLNSEFIANHELPDLLRDAKEERKEERLHILWVAVQKTLVEDTEIEQYQALNNPKEPLIGLSADKFEAEIVSISEKIRDRVFSDE